jgi:hypothetical protein
MEEIRIYSHVLFHSLPYFDPKPVALEQITQPVAVPSLPSCREAPAPPVTTDSPEGGDGDSFPK